MSGIFLILTAVASAQITLPEDFEASTIAAGMLDGRDIVATPDGRILVALGGGDIRVIKNDQLLTNPMLSIPVDNRAQEGLHSLALDENFEQNGYIYASFTPAGVDVNRVSRFQVTGDTASLGSQQVIYDLPPLQGANSHYGAAVVDNGDGTLLITLGDHERSAEAQNLSSLLGSILRINKDGSIPADNPYVGDANVDDAIFAYGFRNPWQIARSANGTIAISDVGASNWEELNIVTARTNYGWDRSEGAGGLGQDPVFTYSHFGQVPGAQFEGCAVTGSTFYEPDVVQLPSRFVGSLFVGDLCSGFIAAVNPNTGEVEEFARGFEALADMVTNPVNGALYVLDRQLADGRSGVSKVEFVGPDATLRVTSQPTSQRLDIGQRASFFVAASGQGDIEYQWQRNGVNIAGETSPLLEIPSVAAGDDGAQFRVVISDDIGTVTSSVVQLTVAANNAPTPVITSPVVGSQYAGGDEITLRGNATDPEDGALPASSLSWEVRLNHDDHDHGFTGTISGDDEITIQIPRTGETSANVWYTVYLRATDSDGATTTVTRRIDPQTVNFALATSPAGGVLNLDGPPQPTPFSTTAVSGIERTVRASVAQDFAGVPHGFVGWSDGGEIEHTLNTPSNGIALTATYAPLPVGAGNEPACRAVAIGDTFVTTYSGDITGSINLRRSNRWIQTVTGFDSFVDADNPGPNSTYTIRIRVGGERVDIPCTEVSWPPNGVTPTPAPPTPTPTPTPTPPPVDGQPTCVVTINGNTATLEFTGTNGSANLRENGNWIATVTGQTNFTHTPASNNYVLRTRPGGTTTDLPCTTGNQTPAPTPTPTPTPTPPPVDGQPTCVVTINGNTATLEFTGTNGSANLRENGNWIATVTGQTNFTHTPASNNYVLRTRPGGTTTDLPCTTGNQTPAPTPTPTPTPTPPPVDGQPTCVVTINGNTATLEFTGTNGSANLRENGNWIATVTGQTNFTHTPASNNYVLRTRPGGTTTDLPCTGG